MNLEAATIMILGGSGLVGRAVARRLLTCRPARIVLVARSERETEETAVQLRPAAGPTAIVTEFGNVYLPGALARLDRATLIGDPVHRGLLVEEVFGDLTDERLAGSFLVQLLERHRPDAVVDCINTATAFAYQDVLGSARELRAAAARGEADLAAVERHLLTQPIPQLARHVQIVVEGLRRAGTRAYVKIGTSGTGGMGFNIPYTHSEERPSRALLIKSAVAGAHTLLLYLLGRTPGAPATAEIKPTAAIGWREIARGPVRRGGREIPLVDCPTPLPLDRAFSGEVGWIELGRPLESVFIDMGENGLFAREEFATITALGQMEFITPEEVAEYVVMELQGRPTGRDVVAALDAATAGPTYRAGILREAALRRLGELEAESGLRSVAFEMLGPPRLTKLLFEAALWSRLFASVAELAAADPETIGRDAEVLLGRDPALRAEIVSVGVPIVSHDGAHVRRGPHVVVPPVAGDPLAAAARGWVDLRPPNCGLWIERARRIVAQARDRHAAMRGSGSDEEWYGIEPADPIVPWRMATWIFRHEDRGERIKR
ncbi:MAG: short-chain dehydrogenase [Gemmatimonadetes bacterium]|nr:short-chain dehydrogenase [Gemmatimonadota bacterium]